MSRTSQFGSPFGSGGTGGRRRLPLVAIAAAALTGTIVGGASAYAVVMAVVQPSKHEARADAVSGGNVTPQAAAAAQPVQASSSPQPQSQPAAQTPAQTPSRTWPDALAARTDHGAAATTPTPSPQEASSSAADQGAAQNQTVEQNQSAVQNLSPSTAEHEYAAPSREMSIGERAPWPTPRSAMKKHAVAASEPASVEPATPAQPDAPKSTGAAGAAPPDSAATNKSRGEPRKSRYVQQQQRTPVEADQSGDDRGPAAYPRQRVIVLPPPQRDASRDHWDHGGGGPFRLFDFSGGDHWNGDRGDDHWSNRR